MNSLSRIDERYLSKLFLAPESELTGMGTAGEETIPAGDVEVATAPHPESAEGAEPGGAAPPRMAGGR